MLWYRYRQVLGRRDTMLYGRRSQRCTFEHVSNSKELRYGKDGPQCRRYGLSCVEWHSAGR